VKPTLVSFDSGSMNREPMELSTGSMLEVAVADLFAQIFKINSCEGVGRTIGSAS
jgi:hypothetical protein